MDSQTVTLTLAPPPGEKIYSFKRLSDTVGQDNQWCPVRFVAPGDTHTDIAMTINSYARLRRHGSDCAQVTQEEFSQQTGINRDSILTFDVEQQ